MAAPVADRAVLDTSVLLAATDDGRAEHEGAVASLNRWPGSSLVPYTSGQIMREYLAVATHPTPQNGLGVARPVAVANLRALRTRLRLLVEDGRVSGRLLEVLEAIECPGGQVYDANVVATMLVHRTDTLVTLNARDFARFGEQVQVIGLSP